MVLGFILLETTYINLNPKFKRVWVFWTDIMDIYQGVQKLCFKEYYEIVDEARPLSGFFPTHADLFTEMHF